MSARDLVVARRRYGADYAFPLGDADVHVWSIDLDMVDAQNEPISVLAPDELYRADCFRRPLHRQRFVHARACLRYILSLYTAVAPRDLEFSYGPFGKPFLWSADGTRRPYFNVAHSNGVAVVAVCAKRRVGIDIEAIDASLDTQGLAERCLSKSEAAGLRSTPPAHRTRAFLSVWVRKEAYLKACGEGLSRPLDSFTVAGDAADRCGSNYERLGCSGNEWEIHPISVSRDYVAGVAVEHIAGEGAGDVFCRYVYNQSGNLRVSSIPGGGSTGSRRRSPNNHGGGMNKVHGTSETHSRSSTAVCITQL